MKTPQTLLVESRTGF